MEENGLPDSELQKRVIHGKAVGNTFFIGKEHVFRPEETGVGADHFSRVQETKAQIKIPSPKLKDASFVEKFSEIPAADKGWMLVNTAFMVMFLHAAWESFHNSVETDVEGKKHIRLGQAAMGCINTLAGGLLAHQNIQSFHGR